MPDVDEASMEALGASDHSHRSYTANLERTMRALGRECCRLRQSGYLTSEQLNRLMATLWSPNTVSRHKARLQELGCLVRIKRRWYLRNFHRCNASIDEMERRREADRARERAKKRRRRSSNPPRGWGKAHPKSVEKSPECAFVPLLENKPRESALTPTPEHCAEAATPPKASRWGHEHRRQPPPRPFTDTELDDLQDEFDRLDEQRRTGDLAGDPPAAPGPQPEKPALASASLSEATAADEAPRSPAASIYAALCGHENLDEVVAKLEAVSASTPAPMAPEEARSVANAKTVKTDGQLRPAAAQAPIRAPVAKVAPSGPLADVAYIRALEQHHGLSGFNAVAALRLGVTRDTARQAFELAQEAKRRMQLHNAHGYVLNTMRRLHQGWACGP